MTIQIELTPEEEAWLRERAARVGQSPQDLAHYMLRAQIPVGASKATQELLPVLDEHGVFHPDRWDAVIASMARRAGRTPVLPPETFTRENLYADHD